MQQILAVGLGGFCGALARYALNGLLHRMIPKFLPAGTFVVNMIGCLLIGLLMAVVVDKPHFSRELRLFLVTGFLGSLTTFSTFGYESWELLYEGKSGLAFVNVLSNVVIGVLLVWCGFALARYSLR